MDFTQELVIFYINFGITRITAPARQGDAAGIDQQDSPLFSYEGNMTVAEYHTLGSKFQCPFHQLAGGMFCAILMPWVGKFKVMKIKQQLFRGRYPRRNFPALRGDFVFFSRRKVGIIVAGVHKETGLCRRRMASISSRTMG